MTADGFDDDFLSPEALARMLHTLNAPLDLAPFLDGDVLRREGNWYRVLDAVRLPEEILLRATAVHQEPRDGATVTLLQFG